MRIPNIRSADAITEADRPTVDFVKTMNALIDIANGLSDRFAIEASYPDGFTPPLIEADDLGNVTIAAHTRYYGDGSSVAVDGDVIATGEVSPSVVRIYYDDARHLGGAVAYQFTVDPVAAPVQSGSRHVVGRVEIPAAGTQVGTYLRPPGYLEP